MSTNLIDEMTEREAKSLLNDIAGQIGIGGKARTKGTILENIRNMKRRSACLSRIESEAITLAYDENGEEFEDCLLNWGHDPEQYIERFKAVFVRAEE